ncbi:MAG: alpha/beta hydrolase [Phycisphaerales bacterium]
MRVGLLLGFLGVGLMLACAILVLHTWWGLTHPRRRGYAYAVSRNLPGDPGELDTPREFAEVTLPATPAAPATTLWDIPGDTAAGPVIVFSHGWGQSRHSVLPRLGAFAPLASRILAWDLPGHGESPGPTRLGLREAAALERVVRWAGEAPARPVVLYGYSLGAGVSLDLAAACPTIVSQVIVEAPYRLPITPARNVLAQRGLPHGWSLRLALRLAGASPAADLTFDRADIARRVSCPVLVLHGAADDISPLKDARAIAAAAPRATLVEIPLGSHKTLWWDTSQREACTRAITTFLTRH